MNKPSSLNQGAQFADMTKTMHGGSRKNLRKNKKMGVAASKSKGSKVSRSSGGKTRKQQSRRQSKSQSKRQLRQSRQSGGSFFTPYADYSTEFDQQLPADMRALSGVGPLDAKFVELPAIERAAGVMMGGGSKKQKGGNAPVDEPSMLLRTPAEEMDARLNPQWYTENTVIPNFRGPVPIPGDAVPAPLYPSAVPVPAVGGQRSSRRNRSSRQQSKSSRRR